MATTAATKPRPEGLRASASAPETATGPTPWTAPGTARTEVAPSRGAASGTARVAAGLAALLAAGSVPLHAWMLMAHAHGPVLTVLMSAMVLWCLWCALGTARSLNSPDTAALRHLCIMAQAMALLHVMLLTGFPGLGAHHHGGAGTATGATGAAADVGSGAADVGSGAGLMLAIVALELAICFAGAVALRAGRRATT